MKINLLTGDDQILTPPPKKRRKIIPEEVEAIALKHWTETTIPEPAVNRRMKRKEKKKKKTGNTEELVPTRWQHLTQREQYSHFKDECSKEVEEVMRKHAQINLEKLQTRPDSDDKTRRVHLYENMHEKFPSESWYQDQKPPEVKPLHDHTTGLCRVCEAAQINHGTLVKTLNKLCVCKTDQCPNWVCFCDDELDEGAKCFCKCDCDSCKKCKVCISVYYNSCCSTLT